MSADPVVKTMPRGQPGTSYDEDNERRYRNAVDEELRNKHDMRGDLRVGDGKALVISSSGGLDYALGLSDAGILTVTNYATGVGGALIIEWDQIDGAAARDVQIAALEASDGTITASVSAIAEAYATDNAGTARLVWSVNVGTNVATIEQTAATGYDDGTWNGSAIKISADEITLDADAINFGAQTEFDTATETFITEAGGVRTRYGAPFGASSDLLRWYGPTSVPQGSETRTNGYLTEGTDGIVRYGASPLNWGATAAEAAASNVLVGAGANSLVDTGFRKITGYWNAFEGDATGSVSASVLSYGSGIRILQAVGSGFTSNGSIILRSSTGTNALPVQPGDRVGARALIGGASLSSIRLGILYFNSAGSFVGGSYDTTITSGIPTGAGEADFFLERSVVGTVPSGAYQAVIDVTGIANGASPRTRMAYPTLAKIPADQTVAPPLSLGMDAAKGADETLINTAGDIISGVIQNQQVSQTASALTLSNNTWTSVASFSFTSVGIGVELRGTCEILSQKSASGGSLGALEWRLLRDSTILKGPIDTKAPITDVSGLGVALNKVAAIVADYNDIPSSGTYTYALQCRINVTDGAVPELTTRQVSNRYLSAREFRR